MSTATPSLQSLVISEEKGLPLFFRLLLPPNLETVAHRDKINVKLEAVVKDEIIPPEKLDRGKAYKLEPAHFIVAMLIENWCEGKLHGMLSLSRDKLRELLTPLQDELAIFYINNSSKPLEWKEDKIPEVHPHLVVTTEETPEEVEKEIKEAAVRKDSIHDEGTPMLIDGSPNFLAISLPSRDSCIYHEAVDLLRAYGFKKEPSNRKWWVRDRHKTLSFLAEYYEVINKRFLAEFTANFREKTKCLRIAELQTKIIEGSDGFDIDMSLTAPGVDDDTIRKAIASSKPYITTDDDKVVMLMREHVDQVTAMQQKLTGDAKHAFSPHFKHRVKFRDIPMAGEVLEDIPGIVAAPDTWKARSSALRDLDALGTPPVPKKLWEMLRPYQKVGAAWLWHLYKNGLAGILADEMGLGKTVQAISFIQCMEKSDSRPVLVICPASLVENWKRECSKFAPNLRSYIHHGAGRVKDPAILIENDVIITSYVTLTNDISLFKNMDLECVIADEAQYIKNRKTQNAKALRALKSEGRFMLTGTPIENSVDDLRSLFEFLLPGMITPIPEGSKPDERSWHNERALKQAASYILRRSKIMVAPDLPEKIEQTIFCRMTDAQAALYKKVEQKSRKEISDMEMKGASEGKIKFAMFQQLLRLRQICAEPRLLDANLSQDDSTKWFSLRVYIQSAQESGSRILVFSQFVKALKQIRDDLDEMGVKYCYLDGQTPPKKRLPICDEFNNNKDITLFLISLKAGGTGLNLTGADTVVHLDPWWNPAIEAQATDRAHRIGQTRTVTSLRLIAADTVEERVLEMQRNKAKILKDLLDASDENTADIALADLKSVIGLDK